MNPSQDVYRDDVDRAAGAYGCYGGTTSALRYSRVYKALPRSGRYRPRLLRKDPRCRSCFKGLACQSSSPSRLLSRESHGPVSCACHSVVQVFQEFAGNSLVLSTLVCSLRILGSQLCFGSALVISGSLETAQHRWKVPFRSRALTRRWCVQVCKLEGCSQQVFFDSATSRVHDFCSKRHADQARAEGTWNPSPGIVGAKKCKLPGCPRGVYIDPVHNVVCTMWYGMLCTL